MQLTEQEIVCPLCREHQVTIQANKKGKPYVFCNNLQIPLNFSTTEAVDFLRQSVERMQARNQPEEPEREEGDIQLPWKKDEDEEDVRLPW